MKTHADSIDENDFRSIIANALNRCRSFRHHAGFGGRPANRLARLRGLITRFLYRRYLKEAHVIGRLTLSGTGIFEIGPRISITSVYCPSVIDCAKGAELVIGENAAINYGVIISSRKSVRIGKNSMIGNMVTISDTLCPMFADAPMHTSETPSSIVIGNDVWLAARVIVLPGANIGDGAVIGAGSVVRGRIPERVVAIGNPARVIMGTFEQK